jgi:hypothetical protein
VFSSCLFWVGPGEDDIENLEYVAVGVQTAFLVDLGPTFTLLVDRFGKLERKSWPNKAGNDEAGAEQGLESACVGAGEQIRIPKGTDKMRSILLAYHGTVTIRFNYVSRRFHTSIPLS